VKILVTGGAGFIGSNFIHYWLSKYPQDKIINLDKLTYAGNLDNLKDLEDNPNYDFVKGDILDHNLVDQLVSQVDTIIHFAAESHVDRSIKGPAVFVKTNVLGTQVLLDSAVKHKIKRFHHISTDEVFGALSLSSDKKFNEQTRYDPHSPYSASKAGSDHLVRAYFDTYDLPITITNGSNNYGPYQNPEKFIPRMITNVIDGKKIPIYGDGKYVRDWLHVKDHCLAIDKVIKHGEPGETYCVGGLKKEVNNLKLAKMILKILNKDEDWLEFVKDRSAHDRRYAVDWSKINKQLGWEPKYSFEQGLKQTVAWYNANENWWKEKKKEAEEFYKKADKN
jgi:dTDP-glucose 4,6-dehydratase